MLDLPGWGNAEAIERLLSGLYVMMGCRLHEKIGPGVQFAQFLFSHRHGEPCNMHKLAPRVMQVATVLEVY